MREPLTVKQVADTIGISPRRVRELCAEGVLPFTKVNARLILIDRKDIKKAERRRPKGRPKRP